jgi:hypothetical protein
LRSLAHVVAKALLVPLSCFVQVLPSQCPMVPWSPTTHTLLESVPPIAYSQFCVGECAIKDAGCPGGLAESDGDDDKPQAVVLISRMHNASAIAAARMIRLHFDFRLKFPGFFQRLIKLQFLDEVFIVYSPPWPIPPVEEPPEEFPEDINSGGHRWKRWSVQPRPRLPLAPSLAVQIKV